MSKQTINPESFAQAVVASHSNHGLNQQLREYVAALELAKSYNADLIKHSHISDKVPIEDQVKYLRNLGL